MHGANHRLMNIGVAKNKNSGYTGNIFFICGELCKGGDLWAYMLHSEALEEVQGNLKLVYARTWYTLTANYFPLFALVRWKQRTRLLLKPHPGSTT